MDSQYYSAFGLTLSASGGEGNAPVVLDTAEPGGETEDACGDSDLGSPNMLCPGGGPGKGEGGEPDGKGPNCNPLGNVLIVQEPDQPCPDDNVDGGVMKFEFDPPVDYVKDIGLLDVDYATVIKISFINEEGEMEDTNIVVPILGDNSYQLLSLDVDEVTGPVKSVSLIMTRSAGVSSLTFCYPPVTAPAPTPALEPTPAVEPTPVTVPTPATEPTPAVEPTPVTVPTPATEPTPAVEPTPVTVPTPATEPTPAVEPTPVTVPTPATEPTPAAEPTPDAVPTPAAREPTPATVPTPATEPTPAVEPTPVTVPTPATEPTPAVEPTPADVPTPAVEPTPVTVPTPATEPTPAVEPTPVTVPTPATEPTPAVEPTPVTVPTPATEPTPAVEPTPVTVPTPATEPTPVTVPTPATEPTPAVEPTPVIAPTPATEPTPAGCIEVELDFNAFEKGESVDSQYSAFGLTLSASGGEGDVPIVLNTADPGGETPDACGDSDLGSPNMRCPGGGPGKGEEGEPDGNGPNCNPLGNVLIVQEPDQPCPDDNVDGGVIKFEFDPPVDYVKDIGLLDVDYATVIKISFINEEGEMEDTNIVVPILGDNSYQLLSLDVAK